MWAAEVTRALRKREAPISDRVLLAKKVLDRNVDVYLPHREQVLLEWTLDMFSTDNSSRSCSSLWQLLGYLWEQTPHEKAIRALRNHRLLDIIIEALPNGPKESMCEAVHSIYSTTQILASSSHQAGKLVLSWLESGAPRLLEDFIDAATRDYSRVFGNMEVSVALLLRCRRFLTEYLKTESAPLILTGLHEPQVVDVLYAIIEANQALGPRFTQLFNTFPSERDSMLRMLVLNNCKIPTSSLKSLVALENCGWTTRSLVLALDAELLVSSMTEVFDWLLSDFNEDFFCKYVQQVSRFRAMPDFLQHFMAHEFEYSLRALNFVSEALKGTSESQLVSVLNRSNTESGVEQLIRCLGFEQVGPALRRRFDDIIKSKGKFGAKRRILELCPDTVFDSTDWVNFHDRFTPMEQQLCLLRARELAIFQWSLDPNVISGDTTAILLRFWMVIRHCASQTTLASLLSHARDVQLLAENHQIQETPEISLVSSECLKRGHISIIARIPWQALDKTHRAHALEAAWNQKDVNSIISLLEHPPHLSEMESDPRYLVKLAEAREGDPEAVAQIARLLCRSEVYRSKLAGEQNLNIVLKAIAFGDIFEEAYKCLTQKENVQAALVALDVAPPKNVPFQFISPLIQPWSQFRAIFELICRTASPEYYLQVTALYILHNNDQFAHAYKDFASRLDQNLLRCLICELLEEQHFDLLSHLITFIPEDELRLLPVAAETVRDDSFDGFCAWSNVLMRDRPNLVSQFGLESLLGIISSKHGHWAGKCVLMNRILYSQRHRCAGRMYLVMEAFIRLANEITDVSKAKQFVRMIENLCNPRYRGKRGQLSSMVSRAKRQAAKYVGVFLVNLLQNSLSGIYSPSVRMALQPAYYEILNILVGDDLRTTAALMDEACREYFRNIYQEYHLSFKWSSD